MKSQIAKVLIVPTCLFEDRTVKYRRFNGRWGDLGTNTASISKESMSIILTTTVMAINCDDIFCNWVHYYEDGVGWGVYVDRDKALELTRIALICYKRDKCKGADIKFYL